MYAIIGKLGGKKFIMALFGAIAIATHNALGIDENAIMMLGGVVAAFVLGQGFADGMSGGATSSTTQDKP